MGDDSEPGNRYWTDEKIDEAIEALRTEMNTDRAAQQQMRSELTQRFADVTLAVHENTNAVHGVSRRVSDLKKEVATAKDERQERDDRLRLESRKAWLAFGGTISVAIIGLIGLLVTGTVHG